jgi:hypothetical protein
MKISLLIFFGLTMAFMVQTGEASSGRPVKETCQAKVVFRPEPEKPEKCSCPTKWGEPKCEPKYGKEE